MKRLLQKILKQLSRLVLKKYKPKIVAITGSVGKTSTKETVFTVLAEKYSVRASLKNYNNEIGVPLTIFNCFSPSHSFIGWLKVISSALMLLIKKDKKYPKYLVLEMGADRPGDISYLKKFIKPDIAIITFISEAHLEYFSTLDNIIKEKFNLIKGLKKHQPILLNCDNDSILKEAKNLKDKLIIFYGFGEQSNIKASNEKLVFNQINRYRALGMEFDCSFRSQAVKIFLPGVISRSQIYSALAAIGVASELGISLEEIKEALKEHHLPAGRMKMILGIKTSLIIDDTYNASPTSAKAAFLSVSRLPLKPGSHRWAILGDMLELGKDSKSSHNSVGKDLVNNKFDYLITVGLRAKEIARGAKEEGLAKDNVFSFDDTTTAGKFLEDRMGTDDIILIKGSQGARMEKVVKEVMADPLRAKDLLVRQDSSWM